MDPYVDRHNDDPDWIVSRLQMYWNTKYERVYVNGMDFSHGEGEAQVPTVRFSGSRDWATDYLMPELENVKPYMDDERGLYLQNGVRENQPWEWVHPSETGHIVEKINRKILNLAEEAAFLYWLDGDEQYAVFAADILIPYMEGMYYRDPPRTVGDHKNALLMGLQTFEVIHEGVIEPITITYDFLYDFLLEKGVDLKMIQEVFRKWADQEIRYGVPDNNWNLMQARFITYLAIALEDDSYYKDGKGQQYYIDQVLNQNSTKQKALKDVVKNYDPNTAIWPEVASYSIMVSDDLLEIICLIDKTLNNHLLNEFPILEKAILANFNYLFPNDFTVAYGDAKHARLRFNSLELLISQNRKYNKLDQEKKITRQLNRFIKSKAYSRDNIKSLFHLFFYLDDLLDIPAAESLGEMVKPVFYSPNVSWIVQRNGHSMTHGMMVSKNASLGNHSHTNGINIELFARGMVIAPDAAAGISYWSKDHREYYSRFPAHNTVVVDGVSDYRNMRGSQAFEINSIFPKPEDQYSPENCYTYSDVTFIEPSTNSTQKRVTGTIRTGESSGYFVDIFRSSRNDGRDKKHEYIFHSQGNPVVLKDLDNNLLTTGPTTELSSSQGDQVGYDYFENKQSVDYSDDFIAQFSFPSISEDQLEVNVWMKGYENRTIFTATSPHSRAVHPSSVPQELYHVRTPTLILRQAGEAESRPFVSIIEAASRDRDPNQIKTVEYFSPSPRNTEFVGIVIHSGEKRSDYIFNSSGSRPRHIFTDAAFEGDYGIISMRGDSLLSMLLGKGTYLQKGFCKLETETENGSVLVIAVGDGFRIDAKQAFRMTMPAPPTAKSPVRFKIEGNTTDEIFERPILEKNNKKYIDVELPALRNTLVQIDY